MLRQFVRLRNKLAQIHAERGATAVEYALMVMLIALVIIAAVIGIGTSLSTLFNRAASSI